MEYRLSLTPRLLAVGLCATVALLVLLFALGYQVGQNMAPPQPLRPLAAAAVAAEPGGGAATAAAEPVPVDAGARYVRPSGDAP